jgi:hypothetical protein
VFTQARFEKLTAFANHFETLARSIALAIVSS